MNKQKLSCNRQANSDYPAYQLAERKPKYDLLFVITNFLWNRYADHLFLTSRLKGITDGLRPAAATEHADAQNKGIEQHPKNT